EARACRRARGPRPGSSQPRPGSSQPRPGSSQPPSGSSQQPSRSSPEKVACPPMDTREQDPPSSRGPRAQRRSGEFFRAPAPGAPPGTLVIDEAAKGEKPRLVLIDYDEHRVEEKELASLDESIAYLTDDRPSITWVDVRGIGDRATLERMGEIFSIHPL